MVPPDVIARLVVIAAGGAGVARATGKTGEAGETMWSSHVDMRSRMTGHTTPHHAAPRRTTTHHAAPHDTTPTTWSAWVSTAGQAIEQPRRGEIPPSTFCPISGFVSVSQYQYQYQYQE